MNGISTCLITGYPISAYKKCENKSHNHKPYLKYEVTINGKIHELAFCIDCMDAICRFIEENRPMLNALLVNGNRIECEDKQIINGVGQIIHTGDLENFIKKYPYNLTPSEKLDSLFLALSDRSNYGGEFVEIDCDDETFYYKYYFKNPHELKFYLETLKEDKLIDLNYNDHITPKGKTVFKLSYKGLLRSVQMKEEGANSNRCFIAMSFDPDDNLIYEEAMIPACENFGFAAIRVDKVHPENEQTINDAIVAEIKRSKFLICDFTKQKNGVYFEAGYGLGRGKKVIYTCQRDHFSSLHFDLNHFPVLIYDTTTELLELLKNKIAAFILD